jgi:hypothetical protein
MGVNVERVLHAVADVAIVAPAEFDHLVAKHGVGNPGDGPLEHIVVVELAGHPAGALRLRPIADLGREGDDFESAVFTAVIPVGDRRIGGRQASLDEADRVGPKEQLTIPGLQRGLPDRLALRVQVPADVAVGKLSKVLLALDREAGTASAGNVVPLNAHIVVFRRLAIVVNGADPALQVGARQVALGELLARIAHPPRGRKNVGLDFVRADRLVGGLQQVLGGLLRGVLRGRWRDHCRGCQKQ